MAISTEEMGLGTDDLGVGEPWNFERMHAPVLVAEREGIRAFGVAKPDGEGGYITVLEFERFIGVDRAGANVWTSIAVDDASGWQDAAQAMGWEAFARGLVAESRQPIDASPEDCIV